MILCVHCHESQCLQIAHDDVDPCFPLSTWTSLSIDIYLQIADRRCNVRTISAWPCVYTYLVRNTGYSNDETNIIIPFSVLQRNTKDQLTFALQFFLYVLLHFFSRSMLPHHRSTPALSLFYNISLLSAIGIRWSHNITVKSRHLYQTAAILTLTSYSLPPIAWITDLEIAKMLHLFHSLSISISSLWKLCCLCTFHCLCFVRIYSEVFTF